MPQVLLLHTGGTLGMRGDPLEPDAYASHLLDTVPEIGQIATIELRIICNLDSSDISPVHWSQLASEIARDYERFDGFVIVHGTDTMSYTASALAFALSGLSKPVVLTGAQRPLASLRTDARRNLADAVELATTRISEVGICFDGLFLRGCRTTKSNSRDYRAFDSPGCAPLARMGVDIELGAHIRSPTMPFGADPRFESGVLALQLTPGLAVEPLRALLRAESGLRGVVLSVFGLGTAPTRDRALGDVLRQAHDEGIDVVAITPAAGSVNLSLYHNSKPLHDARVIAGGSMQIEAAITKLMHALAIHEDREVRRRYMEWSVAGELG